MTTDIILVCHGQSVQTQEGKLLGWWADVPLSDLGKKQAILIGDRLQRQYRVDAIYASPLLRAAQTADIVGRMVQAVPASEPGLRELDGGVLASLSYQEAEARYPDLLMHGGKGAEDRLPGGESYADLHARVAGALSRITTREAGEQVVVVTHGGPIVAYLRAFLCDPRQTPDAPQFACDAASLHHLRIAEGDGKMVVRLNDTAHLLSLPQ